MKIKKEIIKYLVETTNFTKGTTSWDNEGKITICGILVGVIVFPFFLCFLILVGFSKVLNIEVYSEK